MTCKGNNLWSSDLPSCAYDAAATKALGLKRKRSISSHHKEEGGSSERVRRSVGGARTEEWVKRSVGGVRTEEWVKRSVGGVRTEEWVRWKTVLLVLMFVAGLALGVAGWWCSQRGEVVEKRLLGPYSRLVIKDHAL